MVDDLAARFPLLRRDDLPVDTVDLARFLVGKVLVHASADGATVGRIVETEAYPVGDASSHAFRGLTARNRSMFLERGHAYVYQIHRQHCVNVSSEGPGVGAAVLVRALEPLVGLHLMAERRGTAASLSLARGPGRLCAAMGIDRRHDGLDLCAGGALWLASTDCAVGEIGCSVRIGLTREVERRLRFFEAASPFVSGPKWLNGSLSRPLTRALRGAIGGAVGEKGIAHQPIGRDEQAGHAGHP
jgi:DNA-3-methyladenine glycosylase